MSVALRLALLAGGLPAALGFVPSSVGHSPHVPVPPAISKAPVGHGFDRSNQAGARRAHAPVMTWSFAQKHPARYLLRPQTVQTIVDEWSADLVAKEARAREANDTSSQEVMARALASLAEMNRSIAPGGERWEAFALAANFAAFRSAQAIASVTYGPAYSVVVRSVVDRSNPPTGAGDEILRRIVEYGTANGYRVKVDGPVAYEGLIFQSAVGGGFLVDPTRPARVPANLTSFSFVRFA